MQRKHFTAYCIMFPMFHDRQNKLTYRIHEFSGVFGAHYVVFSQLVGYHTREGVYYGHHEERQGRHETIFLEGMK